MPTLRYFRVGGLTFFRVGRLQLSFCVVRPKYRTVAFHCAGQAWSAQIRCN